MRTVSLPGWVHVFAACAALLAAPAAASTQVLSAVLPDARLRGETEVRYLGVPVYDARLFTVAGRPLAWSDSMALELRYRREFSRNALVAATQTELGRRGLSTDLGDRLATCFADVGPEDRFLAVGEGPDRVSFWLNGVRTCALDQPGIRRAFMGIWLDDQSLSPRHTRALLGE